LGWFAAARQSRFQKRSDDETKDTIPATCSRKVIPITRDGHRLLGERLERRIAALEPQLDRARVLEGMSATGEVAIGTRVRVRRIGTRGSPLEYRIVSSIEADPGRGMLSIESPVGRPSSAGAPAIRSRLRRRAGP
jgi:hypothetical protein